MKMERKYLASVSVIWRVVDSCPLYKIGQMTCALYTSALHAVVSLGKAIKHSATKLSTQRRPALKSYVGAENIKFSTEKLSLKVSRTFILNLHYCTWRKKCSDILSEPSEGPPYPGRGPQICSGV